MFVAKIEINHQSYKIVTTNHAEQRMLERGIDKFVIAGNIIALGEVRLQRLQEDWEEAIIIDKERGFSMVIGFHQNLIRIITVLDKTNVFVKGKTGVEVIQ